jgi:hypothetical protein
VAVAAVAKMAQLRVLELMVAVMVAQQETLVALVSLEQL